MSKLADCDAADFNKSLAFFVSGWYFDPLCDDCISGMVDGCVVEYQDDWLHIVPVAPIAHDFNHAKFLVQHGSVLD